MSPEQKPTQTASLKDRWDEFHSQNPTVRIRDAATQLNTTEVELVACYCGIRNSRLEPEFADILNDLEALGPVMALTRNDHVVHETIGIYRNMRQHGSVGMFFPPDIDTRFFFDQWKSVFSVNENDRWSLQFFDHQGIAAHKIYLTEASDRAAFHSLVDRYFATDQSNIESVTTAPDLEKTASDIDSSALQAEWNNINDVHDGLRIIRAHGGDHQQVYQALGTSLAKKLEPNLIERLIKRLSTDKMECMIFVFNSAAVQSYGGAIKKTLRTGPWFNILDPDFSLHLKTEGIAAVWQVHKPSDDGWITTLDVFDHQGREIILFADNRKRGEKESTTWGQLITELSSEP